LVLASTAAALAVGSSARDLLAGLMGHAAVPALVVAIVTLATVASLPWGLLGVGGALTPTAAIHEYK